MFFILLTDFTKLRIVKISERKQISFELDFDYIYLYKDSRISRTRSDKIKQLVFFKEFEKEKYNSPTAMPSKSYYLTYDQAIYTKLMLS